jgi:hypothetical protein
VEVLGADPRSLAVFRIVLTLLVLADLANRHTDLAAHYADRGALPRAVLLDEVLDRWAPAPARRLVLAASRSRCRPKTRIKAVGVCFRIRLTPSRILSTLL